MARTKRTEKAVPKMGEVVSFAALKAKRDATRADVFCGAGVIYDEARGFTREFDDQEMLPYSVFHHEQLMESTRPCVPVPESVGLSAGCRAWARSLAA